MAKKISSDASSLLEFYYDDDIFNRAYEEELDPTSLVLLESGAMVEDSRIASQIAGGGNYFTVPFYKDLDSTIKESNYDGNTDIARNSNDSGVYHGTAWGRSSGWQAKSFVKDFSSADPMAFILRRIKNWESIQEQIRVVGILEAILGVTGANEFADWENHKVNIASSTSDITDDNKIGLTTIRDTAVAANGDRANDYALAIMHSVVANRLEDLQLLNFRVYNVNGMETDVRVGKSGNMTILISDEVPHATNSESGAMEYTTYLLGRGVLGHATAPVEKAVELDRDPQKNGGEDYLYTRKRETIHPYGFSFEMTDLPISPVDTDLSTSSNWKIVTNPKLISIAKVVSNG